MPALRRQNDLEAWRRQLRVLPPPQRLDVILNRYPQGTTMDGIMGMMEIGSSRKVRRQVDGMLRSLERQGKAVLRRVGPDGQVRTWGRECEVIAT